MLREMRYGKRRKKKKKHLYVLSHRSTTEKLRFVQFSSLCLVEIHPTKCAHLMILNHSPILFLHNRVGRFEVGKVEKKNKNSFKMLFWFDEKELGRAGQNLV